MYGINDIFKREYNTYKMGMRKCSVQAQHNSARRRGQRKSGIKRWCIKLNCNKKKG